MKDFLIIHNPRCSKSRETLKLLEDHNIRPQIIDYLQGQLTEDLLRKIIKALKVHPKKVLRTKEEEIKALEIDFENSEEVIQAILKHPKILERPIVLKGDKAIVGRPPENVLQLIWTLRIVFSTVSSKI